MEATSLWIYLYVITRSSFTVESSALVIFCVFFAGSYFVLLETRLKQRAL